MNNEVSNNFSDECVPVSLNLTSLPACFIHDKFLYFRSHNGVLDLIFNIVIVLFTWALFLFPVATIYLTDLSRVLAAERQKFLQSHNLIVEFDFPLGEGPIALLWVRGGLGQFSDFLRDSCDFSAVVCLVVIIVLVVDLVLILLLHVVLVLILGVLVFV